MASFYVIIMIVMNQIGEILMSTNVQKAIPLVEQFKNELTERLNIIDDLTKVRVASYKDFQERYDTWYSNEIEEAYVNWRERQDKSLAKRIAETGNKYAIEGYHWKVSLPNYDKIRAEGDLIDEIGRECFPELGDGFKLSYIVFSKQWSNLVRTYASITGDKECKGIVKALEFAINRLKEILDARISKLRDAVAIAEYEQSNLEEKCKKAMRLYYKKCHDELRRVMQELCDAGKDEFVDTMSNYMIWEDFNIWYKDATEHKRELDEVVKYLDLAKKVI